MSGRSFHFSLAPVMTLRDRAVQAEQEALGATVARRRTAQDAVERASDARSASPATPTSSTVQSLRAAASHRERLARARANAGRALDQARAAEAQQRRVLAVAVREREALAALRKSAADAHRAGALRAETATMDDLALASRYARS